MINDEGFLKTEEEQTIIEKHKAQLRKIDALKAEIDALNLLQNNPLINASSFSIAVFLLKAQIIEFELKITITTLDHDINLSVKEAKSTLNRIVRRAKDIGDLTLGKTIKLFNEFDGFISKKLKDDLKRLNDLRNDFTHNLFVTDKSLSSLKDDACQGIKLADSILLELGSLRKACQGRELLLLRRKMAKKITQDAKQLSAS